MRRTPAPRSTVPLATVSLTLGLSLVACSAANSAGGDSDGADESLSVYATTGYLADAVVNIAPAAEVTTMVGPGGDPHTYQPSTRDIQTIQDADVVFWTGLHLEAQMTDQLESLGDTQLAVGEQIDAERLLDWPEAGQEGEPLYDPHIWNSPEIWTDVVHLIAAKLGETDPGGAETYQRNAEDYAQEIDQTAAAAEEALATVSPDDRTLISGHDAFAYLGVTFDFEVHATDFISTEAQLSAEELSELADLIVENEVPVIFHDNQANPQAITSLQEAVGSRGWEVEVFDEELYADSLGAEDGVDTYLGVFEHNARMIAAALGQ